MSSDGGKSVALLGATGLVGGECLRLLLANPGFSQVRVVTRRHLPDLPASARLSQHVVDFDRLEQSFDVLRCDQIICALGTTIAQAGSRSRFRRVDFEYPLLAARIGLEQGLSHYLLVSAYGANPRSRIFYYRTKGELELALRGMPFRSLTIARPSILVGARREPRRWEAIAAFLAPVIPRAARPVRADEVARALVHAAVEDRAGCRIIESRDIGP